jgi:hypothetical protein
MVESARVPVAECGPEALRPGGPRVVSLLDTHLGVRVPGVLSADECAALVRRVYAGRPFWTADFEGVQFSLGRAWYTHLEQEREEEYFAQARTSNATVERLLPGLQARLREVVSALVGAPAVQREGWCGPGIHVFPAGQWLSHHGGDVHFDTEGLTQAQCARRARALTLVLMLQPAESGGALRLWDVTYAGDERPPDSALEAPRADVDYRVGELLVLDSYRLHQIQPFQGPRDRISATAHAVEPAPGAPWEVWF